MTTLVFKIIEVFSPTSRGFAITDRWLVFSGFVSYLFPSFLTIIDAHSPRWALCSYLILAVCHLWGNFISCRNTWVHRSRVFYLSYFSTYRICSVYYIFLLYLYYLFISCGSTIGSHGISKGRNRGRQDVTPPALDKCWGEAATFAIKREVDSFLSVMITCIILYKVVEEGGRKSDYRECSYIFFVRPSFGFWKENLINWSIVDIRYDCAYEVVYLRERKGKAEISCPSSFFYTNCD